MPWNPNRNFYYWIRDGKVEPADGLSPEYLAWFTEFTNKCVARTVIPNPTGGEKVLVSTVFLAMDHSWGDGPPVLWETMVFGGPLDMYQDRYSSEEDARAGHERVVAEVRDALAQIH